MQDVENGLKLIARAQIRPKFTNIWPALFGTELPKAKQIIELRGCEHGIDMVSMELISRFVLPRKPDPACDAHVLYINFDKKSPLPNIANYLTRFVSGIITDALCIRGVVDRAMENITIVDLSNSTLKASSLMNFTDLVLKDSQIGLVIINNIDEFHPPMYSQEMNSNRFLNKVSLLKLALMEVNILTVYTRYKTATLEELRPYVDSDIALMATALGDTGLKVHFRDDTSQRNVTFDNEAHLHL